MCFGWLKRLYRCIRRKCSRRNRGYSREISLSHRGFCSGSLSDGRASFTCGREGSVTYTRRPPYWPPVVTPVPYSIPASSSCDGHAGHVATSGRSGLTSGWEVAVPVYGSGVVAGYDGGDLGAGYEYSAPLSDPLTAGGVTEGSVCYGGCGAATFPSAEIGPASGDCAQVVQQKCPVVVPTAIKTQQCKQSTQWPPIQKK